MSSVVLVCICVRLLSDSWKPKREGSTSRPPVCQFRFDRLLVGPGFVFLCFCVRDRARPVQVAFQRWSTEQIASNVDGVLELMAIKGAAVVDKEATPAGAAPAPTAAKPSGMVSKTPPTAQLLLGIE